MHLQVLNILASLPSQNEISFWTYCYPAITIGRRRKRFSVIIEVPVTTGCGERRWVAPS